MREIIQLGEAKAIPGYRSDEIDLATIPDIVAWVEADTRCYDPVTKRLFDRVQNKWINAVSGAYPQKINNNFIVPDAATFNLEPYQFGPILNKKEFTVVYVGRRLNPDSKSAQHFLNEKTDTSYSLRLGFSTTGALTWWRGDTTVRLRAFSESFLTSNLNPHILTGTFSTTNGLKLFYNGEFIAEKSTDTRELDDLGVYLTSVRNAAQGHVLVINRDLSKPENAAYLNKLHRALKQRYAIPDYTVPTDLVIT